MAGKIKNNNINTQKLLSDYLAVLKEFNFKIPEWLTRVNFCVDENFTTGYAYANPENNTIYYRPEATEHAIVHELEHLRSRHKESVVGYDELFEKNVNFFFVGFSVGGFKGMFLEEGFNELMARKIYLRMVRNNNGSTLEAGREYREKRYYNFEMYTCFALCSALGVNVEDIAKLKYTGDETAQNVMTEVIKKITRRQKSWDELQGELDSFESAKRIIIGEKNREEYQKENMKNYYGKVYNLLFSMLEQDMISTDEFKKRLKFFEFYTRRSGEYLPEIAKMIQTSKQTAVQNNRKLLAKHLLMIQKTAETEVQKNGYGSFANLDMPEVYPTVTKSYPEEFLKKFFKRKAPAKLAPEIEESSYGLF